VAALSFVEKYGNKMAFQQLVPFYELQGFTLGIHRKPLSVVLHQSNSHTFNVYKLWNYNSESILTVAGCLGHGPGTVRCVVHPACAGRHATRGQRGNPILPHARVAQTEELQGMSSVYDK
jgi:hypothetical protein